MVRELCVLLREEAAAPARDEETAHEPSVPRTREEAGQAEGSDPAEPDEPGPDQGQPPF